MKRFVTILLVLAVLASMGSIAYAEGSDSGSKSLSVNSSSSENVGVTGKFEAAEAPDPKYCVNITWQSMMFKYNLEPHRIWNSETHKWEGGYMLVDSGEEASSRMVTVENRSNAVVNVTAKLKESTPKIEGIVLSLMSNTTPAVNNEATQTLSDASKNVQPGYFYVVVNSSKTYDANPEQFLDSQTVKVGELTLTVQTPVSP